MENFEVLAGSGVDEANQLLKASIAGGRLHEMDLAIDRGADVNKAGDNGYKPIHYAVRTGNVDVVVKLLRSGSRLEDKTKSGHSVFSLAALNGDLKMLQLLVRFGKSVNVAPKVTSLSVAASSSHFNIMGYLLKNGVDVNAVDKRGRAALHVASAKGAYGSAKMLIDNGAQLDIADGKGRLPLHYAAEGEAGDIVILLVKKGSPLDAQDKEGFTALHRAATRTSLDVVATLLEAGARTDIRDSEGLTALYHAMQRELPSIIRQFTESEANTAVIQTVVVRDDQATVKQTVPIAAKKKKAGKWRSEQTVH
jgi:ankyrin repeat protein